MKIFTGKRSREGAHVLVDGKPLDPRNRIRNHSPDGFEWGYSGSGPAQLSFAILAEVYGDDSVELNFYHSFKEVIIARIHGDEWEMTEGTVRDAVKHIVEKVNF